MPTCAAQYVVAMLLSVSSGYCESPAPPPSQTGTASIEPPNWLSATAAKPQIAIPWGIPNVSGIKCNDFKQHFDSLTAATWYLAPSPNTLGIGNLSKRSNRILTSSSAQISWGSHDGPGCTLLRHPWTGGNTQDSPTGNYTWSWPSGPGTPPTQFSGLQPGFPSVNQTEQYAVGTHFRLPGAASAQLSPPSVQSNDFLSKIPMALPERAVEPWTLEVWFIDATVAVRTSIISNSFQSYAATGSDANVFSPAAARRYNGGESRQLLGSTISIKSKHSAFAQFGHCIFLSVVDCPKRLFSPKCSPWNVTIDPADLCAQTTVWDTYSGKTARVTGGSGIDGDSYEDEDRPAPLEDCPARPPLTAPNVSIDSIPAIDPDQMPNGHYRGTNATVRLVGGCTTTSVEPNRRPGGLSALTPTAAWQQLHITVFPPGTIAIVPFDLGFVSTPGMAGGYPWQLNRGMVVSLIVDVPPGRLGPLTNISRVLDYARSPELTNSCKLPILSSQKLNVSGSRPVLLFDAACLDSRSCLPRLSNLTRGGSSSGGAFEADLRAFANSDDVVGLFPKLRVGCAVSYEIEWSTHQSSGIPIDMPAAQNGVGFFVGGESLPYSLDNQWNPAARGRWAPQPGQESTVALGASDQHINQSRSTSKPGGLGFYNHPGANPAVSFVPIGTTVGPYLLYRGPVYPRVYPPDPSETLPTIRGGAWRCDRTSPFASNRGRVMCMALCNHSAQIPVDVGIERKACGVGSGCEWRLTASTTRIWWSAWLGYPTILPQDSLYDNDRLRAAPALGHVLGGSASQNNVMYRVAGTLAPVRPDMQCVDDRPLKTSFELGYSSRWAQRMEPARAKLRFSIEFDRNRAIQAQPSNELLQDQAPGFNYPAPSRAQIQWFEADLLDDLRELAGEPWHKTIRAWDVRVLAIEARQPTIVSIPHAGLPVLPMRIDVMVEILEADVQSSCNRSHMGCQAKQATMRAGSVAQTLSSLLSSENIPLAYGVWLPFVDSSSVSLVVELPCIPATGFEYSADCVPKNWSSAPWAMAGLCASFFAATVWAIAICLSLCCHPLDNDSDAQHLTAAEACGFCRLSGSSTSLRARASVAITKQLLQWFAIGVLYNSGLQVPAISMLVLELVFLSLRISVVLRRVGVCESCREMSISDPDFKIEGSFEASIGSPRRLARQSLNDSIEGETTALDDLCTMDGLRTNASDQRPGRRDRSWKGVISKSSSKASKAAFTEPRNIQRLRQADSSGQQRSGISGLRAPSTAFPPMRPPVRRVSSASACSEYADAPQKSLLCLAFCGSSSVISALSSRTHVLSPWSVGALIGRSTSRGHSASIQVGCTIALEVQLIPIAGQVLSGPAGAALLASDEYSSDPGLPQTAIDPKLLQVRSPEISDSASSSSSEYGEELSARVQAATGVYVEAVKYRLVADVLTLGIMLLVVLCMLGSCPNSMCMSDDSPGLKLMDSRLLLQQRAFICGAVVITVMIGLFGSLVDLCMTTAADL